MAGIEPMFFSVAIVLWSRGSNWFALPRLFQPFLLSFHYDLLGDILETWADNCLKELIFFFLQESQSCNLQ